MERARRNLREKEDLLLLDLGFEPAGKDLWRRDGIHFDREAALQRGQCELLELGDTPSVVDETNFVYLEREQVDATHGKIIVSRELLGALLDNLEKRDDPTPLSPHERESLQQLAVAVMSEDDEIAISRELLEKWGSG
jgi:hypothetical protein